MAHAVHQLTQVGTLVRGKLITGVAQVVKVNRREPCRAESWVPDAAAEVAAPQRLARSYLARPAGFEPATRCLEGSCSVRLSYGRSNVIVHGEDHVMAT